MNMEASELTIVLLCRDRVDYARQSIKAILAQTCEGFSFIVSDNSETDKVQSMLRHEFPRLHHVRWFPPVSFNEHIKLAFQLVETKYVGVFHDDDLLVPSYVSEVVRAFSNLKNAAAIGVNAQTIDSNGLLADSGKAMFQSDCETISFRSRRDFYDRYLSFDGKGIAPFSAYSYELNLIREAIPYLAVGRLYFDTIFLANILRLGQIVWLNKCLVKVRVHNESLSHKALGSALNYKAFVSYVRLDAEMRLDPLDVDKYLLLRRLMYFKRRGSRYLVMFFGYFFCGVISMIFSSAWLRSRIVRKMFPRAYR